MLQPEFRPSIPVQLLWRHHWQHGPLQSCGWIRRSLAVFIERPIVGDRFSSLLGHHHLASGDFAQAHVNQQRFGIGSGAENAMGLVPKMALLPPQGAIAFGLLPNTNATNPDSANRSA